MQWLSFMKTALLYVQKEAEVYFKKRGLGQQRRDSDVHMMMDSGSSRKSHSEKSKSELSAFMLGVKLFPMTTRV